MQSNGVDSPLFLQFCNEEYPKIGGFIPRWQSFSKDLKDRAGPCGREEFSLYARLIDEYIEVLRAFSKGNPIPASLGAASLKILELVLCKIYLEVAGGVQPQVGGRNRPHGKVEKLKLGKQMHEILTRGKVAPPTVTSLVALRRQCKAAMYEADTVVMMQQGGSAAAQTLELAGTAMQALWKHMQYTLYNQRPEEVLAAGASQHTYAQQPPSTAPYYQPPNAPPPASYNPPPPAAYNHPPPPSPYQQPPPTYQQPSLPARPPDYQGPPLAAQSGTTPQPVQPLPNPYANIAPKQAASQAKRPARPPVPLPPSQPEAPADYPPQPQQPYPNPYYPPPPAGSYDPYAPPPAASSAPPLPQRPPKR